MTAFSSEIPARSLPLSSRAPGKCILFGEHAVVRGAPELLLAIDLTTQVLIRDAPTFTLNADASGLEHNPYFRAAVEQCWKETRPVALRAVSRIPRAAGLGSSAAFVAATVAAMGAASGGISRADLAQRSFAVERGAQGVGSPGDTSACVAGGYVTMNGGTGTTLWSLAQDGQTWTVRRAPDPGWTWVVAYTGVPRSTAEAVRAVNRRLDEPGGQELLAEFVRVATEGIHALEAEDRAGVASLMTQNQELLRQAGVSHPRIEALLEAAAPVADGSKLTGAGAGGSIVILPRAGREVELLRRLARAGGLAFVVRPAPMGAELIESTDSQPTPG
ncbi:MAG: mevalonate kinase [Thermoplasmata archaeon]